MLTTVHSAASQTLWPEHLDVAIGASFSYDAITSTADAVAGFAEAEARSTASPMEVMS